VLEHLNSLIDALSLDHRRGAAEIVRDTTVLFIDICRLGAQDIHGLDLLFQRAIRRLVRGQPTMAPVLNLLNRACLAYEKNSGDWKATGDGIVELQSIREGIYAGMITRIGELPRSGDTLLTFSNSSTTAQIITECRNRFGWPKKIICSEARPVNEGLVNAQRLASAGFEVTVYTDAALMSKVDEAEAVWIGGDSLSREGLVNKVGSKALAILAKHERIPFISIMGSDKLLSPGIRPFFHCLPQNPREIGGDETARLNIVNKYYEEIPLDLVTAVFTENGMAKPDLLVESIKDDQVSPLFKSLVQADS
jgi:translation initiation factor 2B subunit (eIF-2B alpha/beta/delta family)